MASLTTEEAISKLQRKYKITYVEAQRRLIKAYYDGNPEIKKVSDFAEYFPLAAGREELQPPPQRPFQDYTAAVARKEFVHPLLSGLGATGALTPEEVQTGRESLETLPARPPGAKGFIADLLGGTAGIAPYFALAEPVAMAGATRFVGMPIVRGAARLFGGTAPKAALTGAEIATRAAGLGGTLGAVEGAEGRSPVQGAETGALLALAGIPLEKAIRSVLHMPKVSLAVQFAARTAKVSPDVYLARLREQMGREPTIVDINTENAKAGGPQIEPFDIYSSQELESVFGPHAYEGPRRVEPSTLPLGAVAKSDVTADEALAMPWETGRPVIREPKPKEPSYTGPKTIFDMSPSKLKGEYLKAHEEAGLSPTEVARDVFGGRGGERGRPEYIEPGTAPFGAPPSEADANAGVRAEARASASPVPLDDPLQPTREKAKRIFRERLKESAKKVTKSEKGAVEFSGPEPERPLVEDGHLIVAGVRVDPAAVFGDDAGSRAFLGTVEANRRQGIWFANMRPTQDVLAGNPLTRSWLAMQTNFETEHGLLVRKLRREADRILARGKITTPQQFEELVSILQETKTQPDGSISVPEVGSLEVRTAARELRENLDKAYEAMTGVSERAAATLHSLGFETQDGKQWENFLRLVKSAQDHPTGEEGPAVQAAADATRGMLNFNSTHDTSVLYNSGYFSFFPLENERAILESAIADLSNKHVYTPEDQARLDSVIKVKKARLEQLETQAAERESKTLPLRDIHPKRQWSGPFSVAKLPGATGMDINKNIPEVLDRYYNMHLQKRVMDHALATSSPHLETESVLDPVYKAYLRNHIGLLRGIEQLHNNYWLTQTAAALNHAVGKSILPEDLKSATAALMKAQVVSKVYFGGRFYVFHALQTLMNTAPITGTGPYLQAVAEIAPGIPKYVFGLEGVEVPAVTKRAWERFLANGGSLEEEGFQGGFRREGAAMKAVGTPARLQRFLNKAIADQAFYNATAPEYGTGKMLRRFRAMLPTSDVDPALTSLSERTRNEIARAGTRATMFDYSRGTAPHFVQSSQLARLAFQFHRYGLEYATMYKNAIKLARAGDTAPLLSMTGAMYLFGGLPALPLIGGHAIWPYFRRAVLKHTGVALPDQSGLSSAFSLLGMGFHSPIDMNESMNPMTHLLDPFASQGISGLLGPTMGGLLDLAQQQVQTGGPTTPGGARALVRFASPMAARLGEAVTEEQRGGVFRGFGTRKAQRLSFPRPGADVGASVFGLRPTVRSQSFMLKRDLQAAIESGSNEAVRKVLDEAKEQRIFIGAKTLASIRRQVQSRAKKPKATVRSFSSVFGD